MARNWLYPLLACPRVTVTRLKPETALSVAVANTLRLHTLEGRLRGVWFHVPNEGKRTHAGASVFKAMGMIPGVHDYAFLWGSGCGLIELKAGKQPLSDNQKVFHRWAGEEGVNQRVCRGVAEVETALREWGALC